MFCLLSYSSRQTNQMRPFVFWENLWHANLLSGLSDLLNYFLICFLGMQNDQIFPIPDQINKQTNSDIYFIVEFSNYMLFFNFRNYTEATDRSPSQLKNGVTPTATHGPIPVSTVWTCLLTKVISSWEIVWLKPLITQKVLLVWINRKNCEKKSWKCWESKYGPGIKEQITSYFLCDWWFCFVQLNQYVTSD